VLGGAAQSRYKVLFQRTKQSCASLHGIPNTMVFGALDSGLCGNDSFWGLVLHLSHEFDDRRLRFLGLLQFS